MDPLEIVKKLKAERTASAAAATELEEREHQAKAEVFRPILEAWMALSDRVVMHPSMMVISGDVILSFVEIGVPGARLKLVPTRGRESWCVAMSVENMPAGVLDPMRAVEQFLEALEPYLEIKEEAGGDDPRHELIDSRVRQGAQWGGAAESIQKMTPEEARAARPGYPPRPGTWVNQAAAYVDGVIFTLPRPYRHADVIKAVIAVTGKAPADSHLGFTLSDGSFACRSKALQVAIDARQVEPPDPQGGVLSGKDKLTTEDLW